MKPTYEELEARVKQLADENAGLKASVNFYAGGFRPVKRPFGLEYIPTEALLNDCGNYAIEALDNTPATDAFLSRLRNEAAERAITNALNACTEQLDTDCVMDSLGISYEDAALRTAGAAELRDAIMSIARQLREGKAGEVCNG